MTSLRKALKHFDEELGSFATQLGQEIHELRRNVENQPVTGATYFRHCLEDLNERLVTTGEDLHALEAVSVDAISLKELVGHCVALYQQNHRQIERLELQLQQFGYTDLFAPLPPENPLDMLELRRPRQAPARRGVFGGEQEEVAAASGGGDGRPAAVHDADGQLQLGWSGREAHELQAGQPAGSSGLEEVTNRLAGVGLHPHLTALRPKTTLKALAPMTAAKALMREDTPSSLASPEALSPSMRELLGRYALSGSSGVLSQPASAARRRSTLPGTHGASPAPAYLSPAFQLAAMEQGMQMANAEAQHGPDEQHGSTPGGEGSSTPQAAATAGASALALALGGGGGYQHWEAGGAATGHSEPDEEVYAAMTQTAQKLANKPSFLEQYRQKFPHIVASTERLLDTVCKSRPQAAPGGDPAAVPEVGSPGAAQPSGQGLAQHALASHVSQPGAGPWAGPLAPVAGGLAASMGQVAEEETTLELRACIISNRSLQAQEPSDALRQAAAAATTTFQPAPPKLAAAGPAELPLQRPAAAPAHAPATAPAAGLPTTVPPLRPVEEEEYVALPTFIRGQLPLEVLNGSLAGLHSMLERRLAAGGHTAFLLEDVDALGLGPKGKTFINSLVKLSRAQLRVAYGQGGGTIYLLS